MERIRKDYILYRISRSVEVYDDACLLAENKRWNSCVNRLYYSSFYIVSALLYKNDIKSGTHNGTKTQFNNHFIKTGLVSKQLGKLYSNLFTWRQESDYSDLFDFDDVTVLPLLDEVAEFNKVIAKLIDVP